MIPIKTKRIIKKRVEGCKVLSLILGDLNFLDDTSNDSFLLSSVCSLFLVTTIFTGLSGETQRKANLFL